MAISKLTTSTLNSFARYNSTSAGNEASGPAQFVIMTDGANCITSDDGFTWTQRTVTGHSSDATWFGKKNGYYTAYSISSGASTWTSADAITWTRAYPYPVGTNQARSWWQQGIFDPNVGFNWFDPNTPTNYWVYPDNVRQTTISVSNFYGYGSVQVGNIIVIAAARYTTTGQPTIVYSTNGGTTWASNNMGGSEAIGCRKPAYANGVFVVSGGSTGVWSSTNGSTWTSRNGSVTGQHVWYEGGLFFCGDYSTSTLYTSTDGLTWTARTSGLSTPVKGVVFGNGLYVAYGASGQVSTSTNGTTWTSRTSNTTQNLQWGIYA